MFVCMYVCVCERDKERERKFSSGWCWCRRKVVTLLGVPHISRTRPSERSGMKIHIVERRETGASKKGRGILLVNAIMSALER